MIEQATDEYIAAIKSEVTELKHKQDMIDTRMQRQEDTLLGEMRHSRRNNIYFSGVDGAKEENGERANMDALCKFLTDDLGLGIDDTSVAKATFQTFSECHKSKMINGNYTVLTCIPNSFFVKRMLNAWKMKGVSINDARKLVDPVKPEIKLIKQKPQLYIDERNYLGKLLGLLKEQSITAEFDGIINNHPAVKIGQHRYSVIDLPDQYTKLIGRPFRAARSGGAGSNSNNGAATSSTTSSRGGRNNRGGRGGRGSRGNRGGRGI